MEKRSANWTLLIELSMVFCNANITEDLDGEDVSSLIHKSNILTLLHDIYRKKSSSILMNCAVFFFCNKTVLRSLFLSSKNNNKIKKPTIDTQYRSFSICRFLFFIIIALSLPVTTTFNYLKKPTDVCCYQDVITTEQMSERKFFFFLVFFSSHFSRLSLR